MGFELLDFPKTVAITTIDYCTYRCTFCPCSTERSAGRLTKKLMEISLFDKIISQLQPYDEYLTRLNLFEFNDPLLDPRIVELTRRARAALPTVSIGLSTAGVVNFSVETYAKLKAAGLSTIFCSIPSLDPVAYQAIMGKDDLGKVLKTIDAIVEYDRDSSILRIGVPLTSAASYDDFIEYFEKQRNVRVCSWLSENRAGLNPNYIAQLPSAAQLIAHPRMSWRRCDRPIDMLTVLHDGRVVLCCADWRKETSLGDLNHSSIEEVWRSPKVRHVQTQIADGRYDEINLCRGCSENPKNQPFKDLFNEDGSLVLT